MKPNIERNKEVIDMITKMAEIAHEFKYFSKDINDEELGDMCDKIKSLMNGTIIELTSLDNYLYTQDMVNWTDGNFHSTLDMAKI